MLRRSTPMHSLGSVECDRPVYQQTGPRDHHWAERVEPGEKRSEEGGIAVEDIM